MLSFFSWPVHERISELNFGTTEALEMRVFNGFFVRRHADALIAATRVGNVARAQQASTKCEWVA
jgi:hypothetical protein